MNFHHQHQCGGCNKPKQHCHCSKPVKEVVHPTQKNVVHKCTEETVKHVHPSHTTVMNHHLVKNEHVYPHSTSVQNTWNETDVNNGMVGGAMSPGMGGAPGMGHQKNCCHKGHQGGHQGQWGPHQGHHHGKPHHCNRPPRPWF